MRAVGAGRFFQSLRRCARCKQDSHCALTRVASELGAKFQCRSRPPCRRIGLSYRCAGRFLASGGGLRPGRPDQVELTPIRCLPPPDLDRSQQQRSKTPRYLSALRYLVAISMSAMLTAGAAAGGTLTRNLAGGRYFRLLRASALTSDREEKQLVL